MVLNFIDSVDKDKLMEELIDFLDIEIKSIIISVRTWNGKSKLLTIDGDNMDTLKISFPHKNKGNYA